MRLYKRTYGLRQICNIAVYIVHSACTIHLLSLPEKTANRDIIHGVKHLEEIAEDWLCARRTLSILSVLARKWQIELPGEASSVFARTDAKYGTFSTADVPSPKELATITPPSAISPSRNPRQSQQSLQQDTEQNAHDQNDLKQSLYSYLPGSQSTTENAQTGLAPRPDSQTQKQQSSGPAQQFKLDQMAGIRSVALLEESLVSSVPYVRYNVSSGTSASNFTPANDFSQSNSNIMSEPSSTRQVSPNTIFGGVDALVESQDWWLRDQANLAMGFDNWMNGDPNGANGLNGLDGNVVDIDSMPGMGLGLYIPANGYAGIDLTGEQ